ncbi:panthothenate synthetase [Methylacidiphilum kamchatkense Kam1]|uniref:Pantothenate synthetase n=1 Tax=Methylacidiphilum kamchatkense Kam1 TaxID=1202785 RepID=A0A0C1RSF5_9BACT|nr:pantoate--beta-alanine ligase [Methylacidiphilum kamchatkense]KIE57851.1 panthothenate synthetase [Methylacidiphilum kamchatkense Kam1]QDQ41474.1 pantoate--beta-alanine ligase [Methylacidiphilum kamchatkense Kam1]
MIEVFDPSIMQSLASKWRKEGQPLCLVPTMGALHNGHIALIQEAKKQAGLTIVSIYVNPTQFAPTEDFGIYPRNYPMDRQICAENGVDVLFAPKELYYEDHSSWVVEEDISKGRCSKTRPGHFRGVATVLMKLFWLIQPTKAIFGWKDAQQLELVRRIVRDFYIPIEIIGVETVREESGLACSSRNAYLTEEQKKIASLFSRILKEASMMAEPEAWARRELEKISCFKVDYVEKVNGRLCGAIWIDKIRLIDNFPCAR